VNEHLDPATGGPDVEESPRNLRSALIRLGIITAIVVIVVWASSRIVDWGQVVEEMADLTAVEWLMLFAVAVVRLAIEPFLLIAVTPGLGWGRALAGYLAPTATVSVVPGPTDVAARYAMYRSWGIPSDTTSAAVILILVFTTFAKVALPVVAAAVLFVFERSTPRLTTVALMSLAGIVVAVIGFWLVLRSEGTARRIGHAIGTAAHRVARWFRIKAPDTLAHDLADKLAAFRARTGDVLTSRTHLAIPAAFAAQAGLFFVLLTSIRVVGIGADELDWIAILSAFALVQLLTSVPITPSGLGVAEAAYVALLAAGSTGGLVAEVTAAALIYRLFSWVIIIPIGGIAWLWWSRSEKDALR
jgi:uncharacterized protein (TIRG00374 family)